jgi:hypothetical protein
MSFTYSRNLRLRIDDNLSASSKYNLERLDLIGISIDTLSNTILRGRGDIILQPNSSAVGGTGTGGRVYLGSVAQPLDALQINAEALEFNAPVGFLDQAVSGTRYLRIRYKSDLSGTVDTAADRNLDFDLQGSDRSVVLGGNLTTVGGSLIATLTGNTNVTFPTSGTLATLADIISGTGDVASYATGWFPADGLTKTVTHSLASTDVVVSVIDLADNSLVNTDSTIVLDSNSIQLTASELPGVSGWRIVVHS